MADQSPSFRVGVVSTSQNKRQVKTVMTVQVVSIMAQAVVVIERAPFCG